MCEDNIFSVHEKMTQSARRIQLKMNIGYRSRRMVHGGEHVWHDRPRHRKRVADVATFEAVGGDGRVGAQKSTP
jgi:hypothetical protein